MKKIIKQFLNFGKPYTLGFGKELFLSLLIFGLFGLSSFCNAEKLEDYISMNRYINVKSNISLNNSSYTNIFNYNDAGASFIETGANTYCIRITATNGTAQTLDMGFANGPTTTPSNLYKLYNDQYGKRVCLYGNKPYLNAKLNSSNNTIQAEIFNLEQIFSGLDLPFGQATVHITDGTYTDNLTLSNGQVIYVINQRIDEIQTYGNNIAFRMLPCEDCPTCPVCKNKALLHFSDMYGFSGSMQIYSGMTLTLEGGEIEGVDQVDDDNIVLETFIQSPSCDYSGYQSQIDSLSGSLNSCQNSLGASSSSLSSCQNSLNSCLSANCPSVGVSWSSLFINDIQHLGASNIYMTIPEEFDWDYSYSNSGENMEIDIEGYNVDYDYINGVVNVQKYKPSSEDFTQVVGILAPYMKIFLFLLFLFIVIKRLKKPFKSRLK